MERALKSGQNQQLTNAGLPWLALKMEEGAMRRGRRCGGLQQLEWPLLTAGGNLSPPTAGDGILPTTRMSRKRTLPRAPGNECSGQHLDLSPMRPALDLGPPDLKMINVCVLSHCAWQFVKAAPEKLRSGEGEGGRNVRGGMSEGKDCG